MVDYMNHKLCLTSPAYDIFINILLEETIHKDYNRYFKYIIATLKTSYSNAKILCYCNNSDESFNEQ